MIVNACQAPEQAALGEHDGRGDAGRSAPSDGERPPPGDAGEAVVPSPEAEDASAAEQPSSGAGGDRSEQGPDGVTGGKSGMGGSGVAGETPARPGGATGSGGAGQGGLSSGAAGSANAGAGNALACEPNSQQCNGNVPEVCDADGIWRSLLACEAPLRCSTGACQEPLGNVCPLFATLPRFSGEQVVDGDGGEFADIAAVTYELRSAPVVSASYAASLPTVVTARLAWTEEAFVAHVHVADPAIFTYEGGILEYFWQGDNVQFFIAPTDVLTGEYSGSEDGGATHLVIVPPSESQPAVAIEVYEPCYACVDASLSAVNYVARAVTDGYEIELAWPWVSPLGMFSPGDRVALNLVVGARDDAAAGLELEGLLANNPVEGDTPCGGATHPGCDDRTWCYSVLE
jgi:hypothetical protein